MAAGRRRRVGGDPERGLGAGDCLPLRAGSRHADRDHGRHRHRRPARHPDPRRRRAGAGPRGAGGGVRQDRDPDSRASRRWYRRFRRSAPHRGAAGRSRSAAGRQRTPAGGGGSTGGKQRAAGAWDAAGQVQNVPDSPAPVAGAPGHFGEAAVAHAATADPAVTSFRALPGRGVSGLVGGRSLILGNARLMAENSISLDALDTTAMNGSGTDGVLSRRKRPGPAPAGGASAFPTRPSPRHPQRFGRCSAWDCARSC